MKAARILLPLLFAAALPAAGRAQDGPDAMVRRALEAGARGDWAGVAALAHPAMLAEWHDAQIRLADARREWIQTMFGEAEGDPFAGSSPPQCVIDHTREQMRAERARMDESPEAVFGIADTAALRATPSRELYARWLAWSAAARGADAASSKPRVVGWVPYADTLALVFVRRDTHDPVPWMEMGLVVAGRAEGGWRVLGEEGTMPRLLGWGEVPVALFPFQMDGSPPPPPAPGSPAAVLLRAREAAGKEDWAAVAALLHPEAREEMRRAPLEVLEATPEGELAERAAQVEAQLAALPPCVQAWHREHREPAPGAEEAAEYVAHQKRRIAGMYGTSDPAVLRAMPSLEVAARDLAASNRRHEPEAAQPGVVAWTEVLGEAAEGDSLVHLAVRRRARGPGPGDQEWSAAKVVSLRRAPEGWRLAQPDGYLPEP